MRATRLIAVLLVGCLPRPNATQSDDAGMTRADDAGVATPDGGQQRPVWTQVMAGNGPSARSGHGMVYESSHRRVVIFGGYSRAADTMLDDTLSWDGARWVNLQPVHHPPARAAAAMVFDGARNRVVLFGGRRPGSGTYGDTWEFDGTDWVEIHPAASPPARWSPAHAWDATRNRTVLFGGWAGNTAKDTWEYDGTTWTEVPNAGGPNNSGYPVATFDGHTGHVVMLSDEVVNRKSITRLWEFDGTTWSERQLALLPDCPEQTVLAFHSTHGLVQYGCIGREGWVWSFDGVSPFLGVLVPAPAGVNSQALTSDTDRQRLVLFGGVGNDGRERDELWELK